MARWLALALLVGCAPVSGGASPATQTPAELRGERQVAGLSLVLTLRDGDGARARAAMDAAWDAADRTARRLLADVEASEIQLLNRVPMRVAIEVSPETAAALRRAQDIALDTGSAFEITLPPLRRLWSGADGEALRDFEIDRVLADVDWSNVQVDDERPVVARYSRRTQVDLEGFARGAVLDAALRALRDAGVPAGRASAGDGHAVYGGEEPWQLSLWAGFPGVSPATLALSEGGAVAVAATDGGEFLDPRSGRPVATTGSQATLVVAPDAASAAAYAYAVFVMGDQGPAFLGKRPELRGAGVLASGKRWGSGELDLRW